MSLSSIMNLTLTAIELGLVTSLTVLALFLSYSMLNVCDLSTDGCFTLGASVGAVVAIMGHPYLAILVAMLSGMLSGLVTSILQTKMGIDSLLAGIIVNTGLYSINIAVMGNSSLLNLIKVETVFTKCKDLLENSFLADYYKVVVILISVIIIVIFLSTFLKTRLGLAIRATGNNMEMVKASSINPKAIIIIGLCISNSFTALSGCMLGFYQKSVNIDMGSGILTIALASLLIGRTLAQKGSIGKKASCSVLGAIIFRIIYTIALRFNMKASMLKLVSSIIVVIAISGPYFKKQLPKINRMYQLRKGRRAC